MCLCVCMFVCAHLYVRVGPVVGLEEGIECTGAEGTDDVSPLS